MSRYSERKKKEAGSRKAASGFTLIEVCVACLLILLALVPLFAMMIMGHKGTAFSIRQNQASNMALELIEALEGLPYDDVTDTKVERLAEDIHPASALAPVFKRKITIEDGKDLRLTAKMAAGDPRELKHFLWYKLIKVQVSWTSQMGTEKMVRFSTLASKVDFEP